LNIQFVREYLTERLPFLSLFWILENAAMNGTCDHRRSRPALQAGLKGSIRCRRIRLIVEYKGWIRWNVYFLKERQNSTEMNVIFRTNEHHAISSNFLAYLILLAFPFVSILTDGREDARTKKSLKMVGGLIHERQTV
jgi:hypothetical protein